LHIYLESNREENLFFRNIKINVNCVLQVHDFEQECDPRLASVAASTTTLSMNFNKSGELKVPCLKVFKMHLVAEDAKEQVL
jgi:hypothetical protein